MHTTINGKQQLTPTTTMFRLKKPVDFHYQAGQFINLELPIPDCDARCNKRNFSLISLPRNTDLEFATRHGESRFKQALLQAQADDPVSFTGPFGKLTLNPDTNIPAVMLAGGIGITPLLALIKDAQWRGLSKPITLIYSNRADVDIPFKNDLDAFEVKYNWFTLHYTLTGDQRIRDWNEQLGRINNEMVIKLVSRPKKAEYYIVGPTKMVLNVRQHVLALGVHPNRVHIELFTGY